MKYATASEKYNERIAALWARMFQQAIAIQERPTIRMLPPCLCIPQSNPDVCVVGMNPSHSAKYLGHQKSLAMEELVKLNPDARKKLMKEQIEAHKHHPYFTAIKRFISSIDNNLAVSFYDLFPIRHTQQSELLQFLDNPINTTLLNELNNATFDFFQETESRMILICNAEASRRFRTIMSSVLTPTNCKAEDRLKILHGSIPVFYSSMLSGQRALDEFSRERLASSIRQFIDNS